MAKKQKLYQTGITEIDSYPVMGGVFSLVGTHGIPIEVILEYFEKNNFVVDWLDYISYALKDGANIGTIKARIASSVGECHGAKYKEQVMKRIEHYYPEE